MHTQDCGRTSIVRWCHALRSSVPSRLFYIDAGSATIHRLPRPRCRARNTVGILHLIGSLL